MKMYSYNTNAHDFRSSKRICSSLTGCLIFVLLMSQTSCRPSDTDIDNDTSEALTYNDKDYIDVDDIDWNPLAAVETTSKVHPIIYYKEDIVSEDYDPTKEKNKTTKQHHANENKPHHRRKYNEISRHHRHRNQTESIRYIKPEKVYFDINPIEHHTKEEDDNSFNEDDIHVEVISLLNEDNVNPNNNNNMSSETDSKYLLNKKPKKFHHHRHRRDVITPLQNKDATNNVSLRHKRNPYYQRTSHYANQLPHYRGVFFDPQMVVYPIKSSAGVKYAVKSPNYYNAYSPGGGKIVNRKPTTAKPIPDDTPDGIVQRFDDSDRPVWPLDKEIRPLTTAAPMRTLPPRRTPPPILQFGDEDYVTSAPLSRPVANPRPAVASASASASASSSTRFNSAAPQATTRQSAPSTASPAKASQADSSRGITACIWAITSCCTSNERISYQCFERLGCSGAFWDLNPCADEILQLAVKAADQYLEK